MNSFNPIKYFANVEKDQKESKTIFRKYRKPTGEELQEMQEEQMNELIENILNTYIFISTKNKSFTLRELLKSEDPAERKYFHRVFENFIESALEINEA